MTTRTALNSPLRIGVFHLVAERATSERPDDSSESASKRAGFRGRPGLLTGREATTARERTCASSGPNSEAWSTREHRPPQWVAMNRGFLLLINTSSRRIANASIEAIAGGMMPRRERVGGPTLMAGAWSHAEWWLASTASSANASRDGFKASSACALSRIAGCFPAAFVRAGM